jgi:hypothetical protein
MRTASAARSAVVPSNGTIIFLKMNLARGLLFLDNSVATVSHVK